MSLLSFFRRSKYRYADNKTVDDCARVVEQTGSLAGQQRTDELASLIRKGEPTPVDVERIGKLLGDT